MLRSVVTPRVDAHLDGVVLRRQAEGVPAHRVQHVEALHALEARDDVGRDVVAAVADAEAVAGRVREEVEAVELGLVALVGRAVGVALLPEALPLLLDGVRVVASVHFSPLSRFWRGKAILPQARARPGEQRVSRHAAASVLNTLPWMSSDRRGDGWRSCGLSKDRRNETRGPDPACFGPQVPHPVRPCLVRALDPWASPPDRGARPLRPWVRAPRSPCRGRSRSTLQGSPLVAR